MERRCISHAPTLTRIHCIDPDHSELRAQVDGGATVLPKLLEALSQAKQIVTSIQVQSVSLEDVFIQLTGRSLRDTRAAPGEARRAAVLGRPS